MKQEEYAFFRITVVNHIWSNQVTTNSRPSTKIRKYFVSKKSDFSKCIKFTLWNNKVQNVPERNWWKQFLFPIFILRCWMIFHPLLKSESFTSSTIDHTFSMKRRDSAELVYFWKNLPHQQFIRKYGKVLWKFMLSFMQWLPMDPFF